MSTKSARRGKSTSAVEVTNISRDGFWLLIGGKELFLSFEQFPWFRHASVGQLLNVEQLQPHHLHWPELDVDLAVDSIEHPEEFPLISKMKLKNGMRARKSSARRG